MRPYLHPAIVDTPPRERYGYAVPEPQCAVVEPIWGDKPMPAKPADIRELRGILYYLESPPKFNDPVVRRSHVDALKRLIGRLEMTSAPSPVWWLAGALKKSYKKVGNIYIVTDRDLATWTLDKLFEMFPDEDSEQ